MKKALAGLRSDLAWVLTLGAKRISYKSTGSKKVSYTRAGGMVSLLVVESVIDTMRPGAHSYLLFLGA